MINYIDLYKISNNETQITYGLKNNTNIIVLYSYNTLVTIKYKNIIYWDNKYHSVTTTKHINKFVGGNIRLFSKEAKIIENLDEFLIKLLNGEKNEI